MTRDEILTKALEEIRDGAANSLVINRRGLEEFARNALEAAAKADAEAWRDCEKCASCEECGGPCANCIQHSDQ